MKVFNISERGNELEHFLINHEKDIVELTLS